MTYPYVDGVWFGSDANGVIAAFVTAGQGPIPISAVPFLENPPAPEEVFLTLPKRGEGTMRVDYKNTQSFVALAERGAYVFDWSDVHKVARDKRGAYELVCSPSGGIHLGSLLPPIVNALGIVPLHQVDFSQVVLLDVKAQVECLDSL